MRLVVSSALILLYSLFVLANFYAALMGGFSVTRGIFLVLSVLAIVALTGKGGSNSQFWAYILCGLLGFAGAILFGYSVWAYARNEPIDSVVMWAGPILVLLAATTYWVIKTGQQRPQDRATELETH
jgi:drug/metabolite transporter (DMT)-like permease